MLHHDDGAQTPAPGVLEEKRFANLKARAALAGIAVHQLADGGYLACRWNMTKELADAAALETWLNQMGVR